MFITAEGLFHVRSFSFAACSEPLGLTFTDVGETTLALEWSESAIPNGIIDNYTVREYLILVKIISKINCFKKFFCGIFPHYLQVVATSPHRFPMQLRTRQTV